jgi:Holliday junction resolvase RusA-like endonuclease
VIRIDIKPLSVNLAWQGKRFKTDAYKQYEHDVLLMLPTLKLPKAPYKLTLMVGFRNKASDLDNICKPFLDILQKKYGMNDKDIYELNLTKVIVLKKQEYIKFKIEHLTK